MAETGARASSEAGEGNPARRAACAANRASDDKKAALNRMLGHNPGVTVTVYEIARAEPCDLQA
jgi:hypothetical protein